MHSSDKFWLLLWAVFGAVILGVTGMVSSCVSHTKETTAAVIKDAMKSGVDPIVARCAMILNNTTAASVGPNETLICLNATKK